jgi:hypothetical protein
MDGARFDRLTRAFAVGASRRRLLGVFLGAGLAPRPSVAKTAPDFAVAARHVAQTAQPACSTDTNAPLDHTPFGGCGHLEPRPACDDSKYREVRARATGPGDSVVIDCDLTLNRGDRIEKRLIFEGSRSSCVRVTCNRATLDGSPGTPNNGYPMIEIKPTPLNGATLVGPAPPENISITGCNILGTVMITSAMRGLSAADRPGKSREPDYVTWVRQTSPKIILLDDLVITGVRDESCYSTPGVPLYVGAGVTYVTLKNSELNGCTRRAVIYLDAESAHNTLRDNKIHVSTPCPEDNCCEGDERCVTGERNCVNCSHREQLSLDGSSFNTIIGNHFDVLDHGGIYLYRNCGEGGTVRHMTPSYNTIVNNVFEYRAGDPTTKPAIWVGSRNGDSFCCWCRCDDDFPCGSGLSNYDHATHNVIAQNRILRRWGGINSGNGCTDEPNYYHGNGPTAAIDRRAGCYLPGVSSWLDGQFIEHGQSDASGTVICRDGELDGGSPYPRDASAIAELPACMQPFRCARRRCGDDCNPNEECCR